jgi:3D (Asp-Asp-Asp) domain-containing protein
MPAAWASRARRRRAGAASLPGALECAKLAVRFLAAVCLAACSTHRPQQRSMPLTREVGPHDAYVATAYSLHGRTASGSITRPGIVAADPSVLPLGSQIRIRDAGAYSGTYTVADTGGAIGGRHIDIYISDRDQARRFGRRHVHVQVLQYAGSRAPSARSHGRLRHARSRHRRVSKTNTGHRAGDRQIVRAT